MNLSMFALSGALRKGSEQQEQKDEIQKMKPKKLSERDPVYVFKKTYTSRCGFLCGTLMMCASLALLNGSCPAYFLKTRRGIAVQGKIGPFEEVFGCNRTDIDSDVCILRGNVHVVTGNISRVPSVILHSRVCRYMDMSSRNEIVKPYPRKRETTSTMLEIQEVPLRCVDDSQEKLLSPKHRNPDRQNICDKIHRVPALLFSSGGLARNFFHAFQDVMIPVFIQTQHLKGDLVLVSTDIRPEWMKRWSKVMQKLSRYPVIDLNQESGQHCFPEVVVGTYVHRHLGLEPSLMPNNETMEDFHRFLYEALATPELKKSNLPGGYPTPLQTNRKALSPPPQTGLPRLLIIERKLTRKLLNQEEVVELARDLKFDVTVGTLNNDMDLQAVYDLVHRSDVVMGVHGAGLTNMIFMRKNAVLVQIVPIGTDWPSTYYFGMPGVKELGLQYMEYKIKPEESSLSDTYGVDHAILQDPESYLQQGWAVSQKLYLLDQHVRANTTGLRETLIAARSAALKAFS